MAYSNGNIGPIKTQIFIFCQKAAKTTPSSVFSYFVVHPRLGRKCQ